MFENAEHKNNFEVEKVGRKNSVNWSHKDSNLIHVDPNHAKSNTIIPENSTNLGRINYSADILAI